MPFPYTQQTWVDGAGGGTPISAARLGVIESGIGLAGVAGVSATPPGSPTDGMIWRLPAVAGSGIYWFFQYDSSQATYKWVFNGGPPWLAEVATAETTASAAYAALATAGPSIALPRAGDYLVEIGCRIGNNTASTTTFMSYDIGATGAVDADGVILSVGASTSNSATNHNTHARSKNSASAQTLTAKYKTNGGTATFADRVMRVTPIRII